MPTVFRGQTVPCTAEGVGQPPAFPLMFNPSKRLLGTIRLIPVSDPSYRKSSISIPVLVGSSVGGVVLGAILGLIIASCFARTRYNKVRRNSSTDSIDQAPYIANQDRPKRYEASPHSPIQAGADGVNNQYLVEPFVHDDSNLTRNTMPPAPTSAYSNTQSDGTTSGTQPTSHVYVVHHDGGGAPVTVFTGGAGVTELPPSYIGRSDDQLAAQPAPGSSHTSDPTDRRPRPGPVPRKSQGLR